MKSMTNQDETLAVHPFEKAGLGKAPFRVIGVEERRGPITISEANGVTMQVGAPGQPMGTCDYCANGIAECWHIQSADGRRFIVGCDCVRKTHDQKMVKEVNRQQYLHRKEAQTKRCEAVAEKVLQGDDETCKLLAAAPSPNERRHEERGESALDWARWMLTHAGHAGRMKVVRLVDRLMKEVT